MLLPPLPSGPDLHDFSRASPSLPLNSQELHGIRKTEEKTGLIQPCSGFHISFQLAILFKYEDDKKRKPSKPPLHPKPTEFNTSLCCVSGGFWHELVYGFNPQAHPPAVSWTNPLKLLRAHSLSCTDGGCSRQPCWGPGDTLGSIPLLALKMKGLMKPNLMKLYLNSNIRPPPLLFQVSVISKTLTFTHWQQF